MSKEPTKVTIDTNVIISALIFGGNSKIIVEKLLKREFVAFTSIQLVSELVETLLIKFIFTKEMILKLDALIVSNFVVVYPTKRINVARDIDDNRVLEVAVTSNSKYIITGDKDLLVIKRYKNIDIISPKEFINNNQIRRTSRA